jgi:nitroimidazol reductase NimA-like FMN-containing flavoprotein (pyridoxamine 5'-phosphate oxidase superfamily)
MNNEINQLLNEPLLARMATANPETHQPHVVPVWYGWDGESLWINSFRSTRKIRDLLKNPLVSVVIDRTGHSEGLGAVILEGKAEIITEPRDFLEEKITWIYTRYLGAEGALAKEPQSWLHDPDALLIKLTPTWSKAWQ